MWVWWRVAGLVFACSVLVAPVHGRTLIVDQTGGGDFTTIQAAINDVNAAGTRDTVIVRAGAYSEHLVYLPAPGALLLCPSGPDSTTALDFTFASGSTSLPWWETRRLGYLQRCSMARGTRLGTWRQCAFRDGFDGTGYCATACLFDCDFYGPVSLRGYTSAFVGLRFHQVPLVAEQQCGLMQFYRCTFEGEPGDTLVHTLNATSLQFVECVFESGAVGLTPVTGGADGFVIEGCVFRDLGLGVSDPSSYIISSAPVIVRSCRFERCERAVSWSAGELQMVADSLFDCGDQAITCAIDATIDGLVVDGCAGNAVDINVGHGVIPDIASVVVQHCTFRNVEGTALRVRRTGAVSTTLRAAVIDNRFVACGAGAEIEAHFINADRNVAFGNVGAGLRLQLLPTSDPIYWDWPIGVFRNTCAFNQGDGLVVHSPLSNLPITRNIAAQNGGRGIVANAGLVTTNDAWQNYGLEYDCTDAGPTNLLIDPLFCDVASGDLTLSARSSLVPTAPIGGMGALGVGCDTDLPAAVVLEDASVLAARPNPARGSVEFALPGRAGAGAVEVLDVQGRRVWSTTFAAGATALRWRGEREAGGRAGAGVYWVRAASGGATVQTRRFVWLE